ncbi:MAG: hypothetical protein FWD94_04990, partial [Treponema sp.]|nr:hypothetical protein [Treponema sp.]
YRKAKYEQARNDLFHKLLSCLVRYAYSTMLPVWCKTFFIDFLKTAGWNGLYGVGTHSNPIQKEEPSL